MNRRTKISEAIRQILISNDYEKMDPWTEALLYAAARCQNVVEKIQPALESNKVVLADRFVDSSLAYQGGGRGLGIENVAKLNKFATGDILPDRVVYFKVSPEVALSRVQRRAETDRLEKERAAFFQSISAAYDTLIAKSPAHFIVIDAGKSPVEVYQALKAAVVPLIEEAIH